MAAGAITCKPKNHSATPVAKTAAIADSLLHKKLSSLRQYALRNARFNQQVVFFIDMRLPADQYRFYVYDLGQQKILHRGLVAQGINTRPDASGRLQFSNRVGSNCTSLGKYSIGQKYRGRFGTAYKLQGLDATNSNAYRRAIVLHKYDDMADKPGEGNIYFSLGCPMVSVPFFTTLSHIIDQSATPILLQISY